MNNKDELSWGHPQWMRNGELVNGLEVHKTAPPIETLLGKYAWAECGADDTHGPDLDKGFELWLEDPKGPVEFPNLQGTISIFEGEGNITGVRRQQSRLEDGPETWELEIDWPEDDECMYPCQGRVYVGIVLDDNGYPFVEVQLGDDWPIPYGYAKRQPVDEKSVGFSEAEKKRINFLSNAEAQAVRDKENAEFKARSLENKQREELKRLEKDALEKNEGFWSEDGHPDLPKISKGARKRANKARRDEAARLTEAEARVDLSKKPAPVGDSACINGTSLQVKMEEVKADPCEVSLAPIKQEDVKAELYESPLVPFEQEETKPFTKERGTKREHEDDTNDTSAKRIKLEQ